MWCVYFIGMISDDSESLHVCTVFTCEHTCFCVEVFMRHMYNISFIHSHTQSNFVHVLMCQCSVWYINLIKSDQITGYSSQSVQFSPVPQSSGINWNKLFI